MSHWRPITLHEKPPYMIQVEDVSSAERCGAVKPRDMQTLSAQMSTNGACRRGVLLSRHFVAATLNIPGLLKSQAGTPLSDPQSCASTCSCSDTRNLSLPSPLPQLTQKREQHLYYPLTFANGWCIAEHIPSSACRVKAAIRCLADVLREGLKCRGLRGLRHRNAYLVWSKWI